MVYEFKQKLANPHFEQVTDVTAQEIKDCADQLTLIDVRQPEEFIGELGHIKNAKLVVLNDLPNQLNTIPRDKPIVFICKSGGRSAQASAYAYSQGITNTYNMQGGMINWNQLLFPTES